MANGNLLSGLPKQQPTDVNLYLFPNMDNKKDSQGLSIASCFSDYGLPYYFQFKVIVMAF